MCIRDRLNAKESYILDEIDFDAIYLENKQIVQISFIDKSNKTQFAVLEVLGMDVTYHKEYLFDGKSIFTEEMYLEAIPKYGWKQFLSLWKFSILNLEKLD